MRRVIILEAEDALSVGNGNPNDGSLQLYTRRMGAIAEADIVISALEGNRFAVVKHRHMEIGSTIDADELTGVLFAIDGEPLDSNRYSNPQGFANEA